MRRRYAATVAAATLLLLMISAPGIVRANGGVAVERFAATRDEFLDPRKVPEVFEVARLQASSRDDSAVQELTRTRIYHRALPTPLLTRLFPGAKYYKWKEAWAPAWQIAVLAKGRVYSLSHFDRLLLDFGITLTDQNAVEVAKGFVLLALAEAPGQLGSGDFPDLRRIVRGDTFHYGFPEVTFLDGKQSYQATSWGGRGPAVRRIWLKVRRSDMTDDWGFRIEGGLVTEVTSSARDLEGYWDLFWDVPASRKGGTGTDSVMTGQVDIDSASVEMEGTLPRYFLIVDSNQAATSRGVLIRLSGLQPNQPRVAIRVRCDDALYRTQPLLDVLVTVDSSGQAQYHWAPVSGTTCRTFVQAYDTLSGDTTLSRVLFLEAIKRGGLWPGETYDIHWCEQFFVHHDSGIAHAPVFLDRTIAALTAAWQKEVGEWNLGQPPDTDHVHQIFLNDGLHWYHTFAGNCTPHVTEDKMALKVDIWMPNQQSYPHEESLLCVAVAHELYHGIEKSLSYSKMGYADWRYFHEGQAEFIPSVLCPGQEFASKSTYYTALANLYPRILLNWSLPDMSVTSPFEGYPYCFFWRWLYEHYRLSPGSTAESLAVIRKCFAKTATLGLDPVADGMEAINRAFADPACPGRFADFSQALDSFAWACALTRPQDSVWYNPNNVYDTITLTKALRVRVVGGESLCSDVIPHSFGLDYIALILDTTPPLESIEVVLAHGSTDTSRLHAQVISVSNDSFRVALPCSVGAGRARDSCVVGVEGWRKAVVCVNRHDIADGFAANYTVIVRPIGKLRPDTVLKPEATPPFCRFPGEPVDIQVIGRYKNESRVPKRFRPDAVIDQQDGPGWAAETSVTCNARDSVDVVFSRDTVRNNWVYAVHCFIDSAREYGFGTDTVNGTFEVRDTTIPPDRDTNLYPPGERDIHPNPSPQRADMGGRFPPPGYSSEHVVRRNASCWHRRAAGQWPCENWNSEYACLRWHARSECWDYLTSAAFDCRSYDHVTLKLRTYFSPRADTGFQAWLRISTDNGQSFDTIKSYHDAINDSEEIDITQLAAGHSNIRLQWYFHGDSTKILAWCVDDVEVKGTPLPGDDVGVSEILFPPPQMPAWYKSSPAISLFNYGCRPETVVTGIVIPGYYERTYTLTLGIGEHRIVVFDTWTPPPGVNCSMLAYVHAQRDQNRGNDTLRSSLRTLNAEWESLACCPYLAKRGARLAGMTVPDSRGGTPDWGDTCVLAMIPNRFDARWYDSPGWQNGGAGRWDSLAWFPITPRKGAGITWGGGDTWYYMPGGNRRRLWAISKRANAWFPLCSLPGKVRTGGAISSDGGDYLYAFSGMSDAQSKSRFYRYSKARDTWETLQSFPMRINYGSALAATEGNHVYAFGVYLFMRPLSNYLFRYDVAQNIWGLAAAPPFPPTKDVCLTWGAGRLWARPGAYAQFMIYDPDRNAWAEGPHVYPYWHHYRDQGAALAFAGGAAYTLRGDRTQIFSWYIDSSSAGGGLDELGASSKRLATAKMLSVPPAVDDTETEEDEEFRGPEFSPDGSWIIFYRLDATNFYQLYKMRPDSSSMIRLTSDSTNHESPHWSPNGQWITYVHADRIAKIRPDGSDLTVLTTGLCMDPQWSPDGQWIVYVKWVGEHRGYRVSADGNYDLPINNSGRLVAPRFSPGGSRIVGIRPIGGVNQVCIVDTATGQLTQATNGTQDCDRPRWSPDGMWLTYESRDADGRVQVFRVSSSGGSSQQLTSGQYDFEYPSFNSTGQWIICSRTEDSVAQICLVPASGGDASDVTCTPSLKAFPEWSPDDQWCAYEEIVSSLDGVERGAIGTARTNLGSIADPEGTTHLPWRFELLPLNPNPASGTVKIAYAVPREAKVSLLVYDATGRSVRALISNRSTKPGYYKATWNCRDDRSRPLADGIYFCRLVAEQERKTRKLTIAH